VDKGQEKVESLNVFRFGLLLAYVMLSAWALVIAVKGHGTAAVLVPLILGMLAFIVGNTMGRADIAFLAWIGLGVGYGSSVFFAQHNLFVSNCVGDAYAGSC